MLRDVRQAERGSHRLRCCAPDTTPLANTNDPTPASISPAQARQRYLKIGQMMLEHVVHHSELATMPHLGLTRSKGLGFGEASRERWEVDAQDRDARDDHQRSPIAGQVPVS